MRALITVALCMLATTAYSAEITQQFSNPAFSGNGWSTHVLTIHQLEQNRKDKLKDDAQAEEDRLEREWKSTNLYKFQNNLESRIYAQMSKQIADSLFAEYATYDMSEEYAKGAVIIGDDGKFYISKTNINLGNSTADSDYWQVWEQADWQSAETPFGDTIKWKREDGIVFVEIYDSNGDLASQFETPVGDFAF